MARTELRFVVDVIALLLANPDEARSRVVVLVGSFVALCLIAGAVIIVVRRKMLTPENPTADQGSLLEQLRQMRDRGEMSQEEFDQTKARMLSKLRSDIGPLTGMRKPASPPNSGSGRPESPSVKRPK